MHIAPRLLLLLSNSLQYVNTYVCTRTNIHYIDAGWLAQHIGPLFEDFKSHLFEPSYFKTFFLHKLYLISITLKFKLEDRLYLYQISTRRGLCARGVDYNW